jgi:hypothetical protein
MKFTQAIQMLDSLCPDTPQGFSPLNFPEKVWEALEEDDQYLALKLWLEESGLTPKDLTVVRGEKGVKLAPPGIWLHNGQPVILFGFDGGKPKTAPLDGLVLSQQKGNIYSIVRGSDNHPLPVRMHLADGKEDYPTFVLNPDALVPHLKTLPTGGDASEDWLKFRDVIGEGEEQTYLVKNFEAKKITKSDGSNFRVWLLETDKGTFSVNERQYAKVEGYQSYWDLMGYEGYLKIRVTQDGYWNGHKVYKVDVC